MAKLFGSGTKKCGTGKAADSGYRTMKTTTPKLQVKLPALQGLFQSGTSGTGRQVTGKAADSNYTVAKKQVSQAANRQTVQNWWNNEQAKTAQDNSSTRAYTAKLTGGANIDNSAEMMKNLQRTFGGANDSAKTQYDRTLQSKLGYGRNWGNPRSTVGNAIESGIAGTAAGWLNAAGTALKSDQRSGLAVDSGDMEAKAAGDEWYNRAGNYLQKEADWAQMLSENAYLRGSRKLNNPTPDNHAMNRAGNIAIREETDYTENDKTEAQNYAKVYLRDSSERFGGADSGGQVSAVEESTGRASRGYISGNRVFVRADHPRYTSEQIMLHEAGHDMIAAGEVDLNEVRDYITENRNVGKTTWRLLKMARVLTENQELLTGYLAAVGCDPIAVMLMVTELWEERAVLEMLEFCASNPNASQAQLLRASSEISSRYGTEE